MFSKTPQIAIHGIVPWDDDIQWLTIEQLIGRSCVPHGAGGEAGVFAAFLPLQPVYLFFLVYSDGKKYKTGSVDRNVNIHFNRFVVFLVVINVACVLCRHPWA